jgi:hypothetical protein
MSGRRLHVVAACDAESRYSVDMTSGLSHDFSVVGCACVFSRLYKADDERGRTLVTCKVHGGDCDCVQPGALSPRIRTITTTDSIDERDRSCYKLIQIVSVNDYFHRELKAKDGIKLLDIIQLAVKKIVL